MNMKFAALAVVCTLSLAAMAPRAAAADNGFYLGAGVTPTEFDTDFGSESLDDNSFKVIAGWRPLDWIAFEANYIDLGGESVSDGITDVSVDTTAITVSGLVLAEIGIVDLYARVGIAQWDADISIEEPGFSLNGSDDGTDVVYGAGVGVHFGSIGVRAEYEQFEAEDIDIGTISVSLTYTFL
jgi:hypothetical protein